MAQLRLTETSYIVLGLLERLQAATPYDLKQVAQLSTVNFWTVPHTQIYTECARLADVGLLAEEREQTGRRRRIFTLTEAGAAALQAWLAKPTFKEYEFRDTATLQLFFGADPIPLAERQVQVHTQRLAMYEELMEGLSEAPRGWRLALAHGISHERAFVSFWSSVLEGGEDGAGESAGK